MSYGGKESVARSYDCVKENDRFVPRSVMFGKLEISHLMIKTSSGNLTAVR